MAGLILVIVAIIDAFAEIVEATVAVLGYAREGKRRRKRKKTGKHYRP